MSKLRLSMSADLTTGYTFNRKTGFEFDIIENEDPERFYYNADGGDSERTQNMKILKDGVYKISYNIAAYSGRDFYKFTFIDLYGNTLDNRNITPSETFERAEYIQSFELKDGQTSDLFYSLYFTAYYGEITQPATNWLEIEYLGTIQEYTTLPSEFISYPTIFNFWPEHTRGKDTYLSRPPELHLYRDLLGIFQTESPYEYKIQQSSTYKFKISSQIQNVELSSSPAYFHFSILINGSLYERIEQSSIAFEEIRDFSYEREIELLDGDILSFAIYSSELIYLTNAFIGLKQEAQPPQPNVKLGGVTRVLHNPTTVAFRLDKIQFKKTIDGESLEETHQRKLLRNILYNDVIDSTIRESGDEVTIELLIRDEPIFKFLKDAPTHAYQLVYFERDTAGRSREILAFPEKIEESNSVDGSYIKLYCKQKSKILETNIVNNQNHVIGLTEEDLQVSEQSSTDFIYPETWNKYIVQENSLLAIENIINRNLINPFKLENGIFGNLSATRKMVGLLGVSFIDLGSYSGSVIDLELSQENTIKDALETIFDTIGHRLDWELIPSEAGYYINFFAPTELVIDFNDALRWIDSYSFTRDYEKANIVTASGTGFNSQTEMNIELLQHTVKPTELVIDVKDSARNSSAMASKLAKLEVPKDKDIYTSVIAFKSGSSISNYDVRPRTKITFKKNQDVFYMQVTEVTISIDSNGVNFIYDLETNTEVET